MKTKMKAKRFFIGLIIACVVMFASCSRISEMDNDPFGGITPDMGKNLHEFGRSAVWNATRMPLGKTGFKATAGPNKYTDKPNQDWSYYSINVEKSDGKASYVYFQRDFRMDEIPKDIVDKKVQDIVTFDEKSRVVKFDLGTRIETYTLPSR